MNYPMMDDYKPNWVFKIRLTACCLLVFFHNLKCHLWNSVIRLEQFVGFQDAEREVSLKMIQHMYSLPLISAYLYRCVLNSK